MKLICPLKKSTGADTYSILNTELCLISFASTDSIQFFAPIDTRMLSRFSLVIKILVEFQQEFDT